MRKSMRPTNLIDRIYNDLCAGVITVHTERSTLIERYGTPGKPDPWMEYMIALRSFGEEHGCLVMIDETRDIYVEAVDDGRLSREEAVRAFEPKLRMHLKLFPKKEATYAIFCLPKGDYRYEGKAFFDERAEYLWSARI